MRPPTHPAACAHSALVLPVALPAPIHPRRRCALAAMGCIFAFFFFPRESSWSQGDGHASHDVDALCSVAWCLQQAGSHLHVQMCVEPLAQQRNLFLARPFPSVNCRLSECLWWTQTPNQQGCWRCTNMPDTKTLGCKFCVA